MKNITLSADPELIEGARNEARARQTTLNQMFRDWLEGLAIQKQRVRQTQAEALIDRLVGQTNAGRKFTRDEMNER